MISTEEPTLDLRRPRRLLTERLLITPEHARWLRDACPGDLEVAVVVSSLMYACLDVDRQRAVLGMMDRWQATDVSSGRRPSRHQLEDLRRYALDAGDASAYYVCALAARPSEAGWIPSAREDLAAEVCRVAWNQRAARLRGLGVQPLAGAAVGGGAS